MKIRASQLGRIVEGDTPYGRFRFNIDADGKLIDYEFEMRTPDAPPPPAPRPLSPGSLLTTAIRLITGEEPGPACKCKARAQKMNEWGWLGCARNRATIAEWLVDEARKRNHEIDERKALSLFKAAWKEIRQGRKDEATRPS